MLLSDRLTRTETEGKLCLEVTGITVQVLIRYHHDHPFTPTDQQHTVLSSYNHLQINNIQYYPAITTYRSTTYSIIQL